MLPSERAFCTCSFPCIRFRRRVVGSWATGMKIWRTQVCFKLNLRCDDHWKEGDLPAFLCTFRDQNASFPTFTINNEYLYCTPIFVQNFYDPQDVIWEFDLQEEAVGAWGSNREFWKCFFLTSLQHLVWPPLRKLYVPSLLKASTIAFSKQHPGIKHILFFQSCRIFGDFWNFPFLFFK